MALWSGRFEESVGQFTQRFGASLPIDKKMYRQDVAGSIAHARMLARQGVITQTDFEHIEVGLLEIENQIRQGRFRYDADDEDIHMAIERELTHDIGAAGQRLHTGRSRNDQVVTDTRLFAKQRACCFQQSRKVLSLQRLQQAGQIKALRRHGRLRSFAAPAGWTAPAASAAAPAAFADR